MTIETTNIEGLLLIKPTVFQDERGYFMESFHSMKFKQHTNIDLEFVQDNESKSMKGVVRGLHYQNSPHAQGKLVRVVQGSVIDVAVDLRTASPTYGEYYATILSSENKHQLYIPPGFAHGFGVLEDNSIFAYKCTGYYNKASEGCIRWNDPVINIEWGIKNPIVSEKDQTECVSWVSFKSHF